MKLSIYFWGIIGFFSIVIVLLIWKHFSKGSHYQEKCTVDDDCSKGYKCIFSRDMNHNICVPSNDKECNISKDITQMQSCDPTDNNSCNMCINQPAFSCVVVGKLELKTGGTGYKDGICSTTTTGSGTGMILNIKTSDGVVKDVSIIETGNNYTKNETITILSVGSDNLATLKFSENPYSWKKGTDIINVPESLENKGWCLPDVKQTTSCNQFTSDTILVEKEDKKYEWGCHCTIQNLFDQLSPLSDCNLEKACGHDSESGELYVVGKNRSSCTKNSDCIGSDADSLCCLVDTTGTETGNCDDAISGDKYCHVPWLSQQNSDPRYGRCECRKGLTYYGTNYNNIYTKSCVSDSCSPGTKSNEGGTCTCPVGYINCPEDIPDSILKTSCANNPKCIPDPCLPLGEYDKQTKTCKCDKSTTAAVKNVDQPPIGQICVELCENNGPCGSGDYKRGTCTVSGSDPDKKAVCNNCVCPYCNSGDFDCKNSSEQISNCSLTLNHKVGKNANCNSDSHAECCPGYTCGGPSWSGFRYCV